MHAAIRTLLAVTSTLCVLGPALPARAAQGLTLAASLGGGAAPGGVLGGGDLSVRYGVTRAWHVVASARSATVRAAGSADVAPLGPDDLWLVALVIGPAFALQTAAGETRLALLLTHVHHAAPGAWRRDTLAAIAADSAGPVQHRSGGEVALGHAVPLGWTLWGWKPARDATSASA